MRSGTAETFAGARADHRIGPNAVLQLLPVLDARLGLTAREELMRRAGLDRPPCDHGLMDEAPAVSLHQALRRSYPARAEALASEAGTRTGDYIIAHRIPRLVAFVLKRLPVRVASLLLARAIEKHAWTFAGSGRFRIASTRPVTFELHDNPVVRGESAIHPLCVWHAAVFERLYAVLVDARLRCRETHCCACGAPACRFVVY